MKSGELLQRDIDRFFSLRQHQADGRFAERLRRLQEWQAARIQRTHHQVISDPKLGPGIDFLFVEVYGGRDLRPVATDIRRALPKALKLLPDRVMATSALSLEAAVLTQELDEALVDTLHDRLDGPIDDALYQQGYRALGREACRRQQLALVGEVGHAVDRYVRSRMIQGTFRLVRRPAHAAGFGNLYDFLQRGFGALGAMGGVGPVLEQVAGTEETIMQRLFSGHPAPFDGPES